MNNNINPDVMNCISRIYTALKTNSKDLPNIVEEIKENYPNDINLNYYAGIYYERIKFFENAETQFLKCLKLNSKFIPPYFNLIKYYIDINEFYKAETLLLTIIHMKDTKIYNNNHQYIDDNNRIYAYKLLTEQYMKKSNDERKYLDKTKTLFEELIELLHKRGKSNTWEYIHMEAWKNSHKLLASVYSKTDMDKAYECCINGIEVPYKIKISTQQEDTSIISSIDENLETDKLMYMNYIEHKTEKKDYEFLKKYDMIPKVQQKGTIVKDKIRIGYLSPDFNKNAVGLFLTSLLKYYDKNTFEVYCYYTNIGSDEFTQIFKSYVDNWFNISMMDVDAKIELINNHNLDIFVDLICHGHNNPISKSFNKLNCPNIVNYLGYPNTSGLTGVNYRITDAIADPITKNRQYYSETLIYLPRCFINYTLFQNITLPPIRTIAEPNKIYLGIMNKTEKQNKKMRTLWKTIVKSHKNVILCIKLNVPEDKTLYSDFPKNQLKFFEFNEKLEGYLELFNEIDYSLDTYPYSGTTTTCSSLVMGVPVFTIYKKKAQHVSNVSASICSNAGLKQYLCNDEADYINKIENMINKFNRNDNNKQLIRQQFIESMDETKFMKDYETALKTLVNYN